MAEYKNRLSGHLKDTNFTHFFINSVLSSVTKNRAIGLVEKWFTQKHTASIKQQKWYKNAFSKFPRMTRDIIYRIRFCEQKITNMSLLKA